MPNLLNSLGRSLRSSFGLWVLHGSAVLVPVTLHLLGVEPWWVLGFGGLTIFIVYLFIASQESQRQEFWISPLSFYFWWYSVGYGLSAIYAASQAYDPGYMPLGSQLVVSNDLAFGYLISLLGAFSLHGGYLAVRALSEKNDDARRAQNGPPNRQSFAFVFCVGILALVRPEYLSGLGAARAILQLAPFGIMLAFCSSPRQRFFLTSRVYGAYFVIGNLILLAAAFYNGTKYYSMLALLPAFSAIMVRQAYRRLVPAIIIIGAVVYLFVVAPIIMTARTVKNVDSQFDKIAIAVDDARASILEDPFFAFGDQLEKFFYRQFESDAVGFIAADVADHGFRYGETMSNLKYAFVPRILWPNKPQVTRGNWFTAYLGDSGSEEESETSTGMYAAGELYWNFGLAGVAVGMGLIGAIFAFIAHLMGRQTNTLLVPLIVWMNLLARIVEQAAATEVFVLLVYLVLLSIACRVLTNQGMLSAGRGSLTRGDRRLLARRMGHSRG